MAKSVVKEVTEMRPVVVGKEIVLTLTELEASTLASVLINISGNSKCSARRYADAVLVALTKTGVDPLYGHTAHCKLTGFLHFSEDPTLKGD